MSVPDVLSPQERLVLSLRGLYESYGYARFPMRLSLIHIWVPRHGWSGRLRWGAP